MRRFIKLFGYDYGTRFPRFDSIPEFTGPAGGVDPYNMPNRARTKSRLLPEHHISIDVKSQRQFGTSEKARALKKAGL